MKEFRFVISTPDGNLYEGNIVKISLRASEGDIAIMANHTPLVTSVKPCKCNMELVDGTRKVFEVERGLLSVSADVVTLMSGSAKWI
ncbi:MAG: F0F1 ATP synthase subunit epsilon [Clostridia bacterium]|nr:F0F1 ATP synthase subunit epsilon [Clostridia bacterium]